MRRHRPTWPQSRQDRPSAPGYRALLNAVGPTDHGRITLHQLPRRCATSNDTRPSATSGYEWHAAGSVLLHPIGYIDCAIGWKTVLRWTQDCMVHSGAHAFHRE